MAKSVGYANPPHGFNRRTVQKYLKQGKKFYTPLEILELLRKMENPYSDWDPRRKDRLFIRDKTLISLTIISCARMNEVLQVKKTQLNYDKEPKFLVIERFRVSKRKKRREEFIELPLTIKETAKLYPFTEMFIDHAKSIKKEEDPLFKIGYRRANQIISSLNPDIFPHFLRACGFTYYLNLLKNPFGVAEMFGVKKAQTLRRYYSGGWRQFIPELSM